MKEKYKNISDFLMKMNTHDLANANVVSTFLMVLSHLESENDDTVVLRKVREEFDRLEKILSWEIRSYNGHSYATFKDSPQPRVLHRETDVSEKSMDDSVVEDSDK
jgi:hypothetical protein